MKSVFHNFERAFIEANKIKVFGKWDPDFKMWYISDKTDFSVICDKYNGNGEKIFNAKVKANFVLFFLQMN